MLGAPGKTPVINWLVLGLPFKSVFECTFPYCENWRLAFYIILSSTPTIKNVLNLILKEHSPKSDL